MRIKKNGRTLLLVTHSGIGLLQVTHSLWYRVVAVSSAQLEPDGPTSGVECLHAHVMIGYFVRGPHARFA